MLLYGVMGLKDLVKLKIEDGILERVRRSANVSAGTHSDLDVVGLLAETRRNKLEELVLLHGGKSVLRGEDEAHLHLLDGRTLGERERLHLSRREGGLDLNLCHYNIYARVSYE